MRCCVVLVVLFVSIGAAQVGRIDTVGGTTYDWWLTGPARRYIANAPDHGIPATWIRSLAEQTTFPDRNMGYNYYDYATRRWVGNDTDHMQSGTDVYTERSGFGTVDVDPSTGVAYVSAHHGVVSLKSSIAREVGHGSFLFEYCEGNEGYLWPVTALDSAGWVHAALIDDATHDEVYYSRMRTWCQWEQPQHAAGTMPDPEYPSHNISASKTSGHVAETWVLADGSVPHWAYYRESRDGGETWSLPQELPPPDAFEGDTSESFHLGVFPYCDGQGRLHVVAEVLPVVDSVSSIVPAEIWHWCPENTPAWNEVARAGCDPENLGATVGYNATYAGRPSIGEDRLGGLHVCWEQFDSLNIEPGPPEYLRADIWYCRDNRDNGASWQDPVRITVPDQTSKRFPCIYDYAHEDTMRVLYLVDVVAGFFVQGEGHPTRNPVICQHIPIEVGGVEEKAEGGGMRAEPLMPTVLRVPDLARIDCRVLDIQGRDVTEEKARLAPGIYFIGKGSRGRGSEGSRVRKVILQQ